MTVNRKPGAKPAGKWLGNFRSEQVRALDPGRHTLIEASAGTGKTFAIEHLVLRLLMENPEWNPEEILLLSFTEKTVAELRDRIRGLLRAQLDNSSPEKQIEGWSSRDLDRIRQVWLHADDLSVHTLHAFCQSALRRDPVGNNALIRTTLTDDAAMADIALDHLLRGVWAADAARLQGLLEALGIKAGDNWRRKLIRLTLKWQPWRRDILEPDRDPGTLAALELEAEAAVRKLPGAISAVEGGTFPIAEYRKSFAFTATGRARKDPDEALRKDAWQKVFLMAEEGRKDASRPSWDSEVVLRAFRKAFSATAVVVTRGWESALPQAAANLREWNDLASVCTDIRRLCDRVTEARTLRKLGILSEAAQELRAALDAQKLRRGFISYEDMPRNLVEALRSHPRIGERLRARYKACIVDEFQDTDPLQWEILETLCLGGDSESGEGSQAREDSPALPLFLVGDPKQAIYSFRGGDLRTYMTARARFRELATQARAQGLGLDANHRSRKPLIDALNAVFAQDAWFGPPPNIPPDDAWHLPGVSDNIAFTPVHAGRSDAEVGSGAAIFLRDLGNVPTGMDGKPIPPRKAAVERDVRNWIAARIAKAIHNGARPGDFAVLARGNTEGEAVARLLRRRGVPCRIRRKGGPFQGPAADALRLLLEWIEDAVSPDAQARILLLPFARRDAGDMPQGRPDRCPPLIARWAALARAGRWPEFLEAVLHEGGYRERLVADSPAEAARFDRLIDVLSEAGAAPGTTSRALCGRFDAMRRGEEAADQDEGEDGAGDGDGTVTVMTLHLSKGLEFRHVFVVASGAGSKDDFLVLRDAGATGFRIALDKQDAALKQQADAQAHEENKRLYYVAFTRAKETLHIPLLPTKYAKAAPGPLGGFAADALRAAANAPETAQFVRFDTAELWTGVLHPGRPSGDPGEAAESAPAAASSRDTLLGNARAAFARRRHLSSYSRLAHQAGENIVTTVAEPLLDEDGSRIERQESAPETEGEEPVAAQGITAEELPPGAASGTALHAILEHTVFASVLQAEDPAAWLALHGNRERIEEALRRESVAPVCALAAACAVWNTLRMPLPDPAGGPTFRLADISGTADYHHEMEFLLPFSGAPPRTMALPEGIARRGTFLTGFIDLVFRRNGRYYLLDWKSNLLPAYDPASVRRSMESHQYDLQWKLYAVVLDRWLQTRLRNYDPETHFGGVHYLYLRGATPDRFSGYSGRPDTRQLREDFPAEIARLLSNEGFTGAGREKMEAAS